MYQNAAKLRRQSGACKQLSGAQLPGKAQNARVRPMQKRQGPLDFALLITVVIICAFGLVMVFSASYYYAQSRNMDNGFYYLKNQSMYFAIGFAIMLALSFF